MFTPRHRLAVLVLLWAVPALLTACTDDERPDSAPPSAAAAPATPTLDARPTAVPPQGSPIPRSTVTPTPGPMAELTPAIAPAMLVDGLPEGSVGPLLVYAAFGGSYNSHDGAWSKSVIHVYDAGLGRQVSSFDMDRRDRDYGARLLGNDVLAFRGSDSVVAYALDGTSRTLYRASNSLEVLSMKASPDGKVLAVLESSSNHGDAADMSVVFIAIATGQELQRTGDPFATATFRGDASLWGWRQDGSAVVVYHVWEGVLGIAVVGLDGSTTYTNRAGTVGPRGYFAVAGKHGLGCWVREEIEVFDIESGETVTKASIPGTVVREFAWYPDESIVFFAVGAYREPDRDPDDWCPPHYDEDEPPEWYALHVTTGVVVQVEDVHVPDDSPPVSDRVHVSCSLGEQYDSVDCYLSGFRPVPGNLVLDGEVIAIDYIHRILGWTEVP